MQFPRKLSPLVLAILFAVFVAAQWQLEVVDCEIGRFWAGWHDYYDFPFQVLRLYGDDMWKAHDFWMFVLDVTFLLAVIVAYRMPRPPWWPPQSDEVHIKRPPQPASQPLQDSSREE